MHVFAHNGNLPGIQTQLPLERSETIVPVGDTDSEHAFCLLMQKLEQARQAQGKPLSLKMRIEFVRQFARTIGKLGPANFLYADGDVLFVYGHVRTQADGKRCSPGLHYRSVECAYGQGRSETLSVELESADIQTVTLVSTSPLHETGWVPMARDQLIVIRNGNIIYSETG